MYITQKSNDTFALVISFKRQGKVTRECDEVKITDMREEYYLFSVIFTQFHCH